MTYSTNPPPPPNPSFGTVATGILIMAAVLACIVAVGWLTSCKPAADAGTIAAHAVEAGAPFDQAMADCESKALALDSPDSVKCATYNECQRSVARQYGVPDTFGHCEDGGTP